MPVIAAIIGNRFGQIGIALVAGYFFGFYSVPRVDVPAIVRNAEAGRDAHWQNVLRQKERENDARVAAAQEAADAEPDVPADRAERLRLCRQSPTCRSRNGG
jgi:hypothetical protein